MKFDREKARKQLAKRTEDSYNRKDGDTNYKYFNPERDINLWTPRITKNEPHLIDIIPYLAGPNHPILDRRNPVREGDYAYVLEVYVHQYIGPQKAWLVCPARNYGKKCPICEDIDAQTAAGVEYEQMSAITLKRRCVYNVVVYDKTANENIVQLWEVSYKYSEKPIQLQAKSPRSGGIEPFSDPDIGKSISFEVANDEYRTVQGHKLVARDYKITDEILDQAKTLDQEIVVLSYDEISKIYYVKDSVETSDLSVDSEQEKDVPHNIVNKGENEKSSRVSANESQNSCPSGGSFGIDIDQLEGCGPCKEYNACAEEADKIEAKKKELRQQRLVSNSEKESIQQASSGRGVLRRRPTA
jgi:hypothetical protein